MSLDPGQALLTAVPAIVPLAAVSLPLVVASIFAFIAWGILLLAYPNLAASLKRDENRFVVIVYFPAFGSLGGAVNLIKESVNQLITSLKGILNVDLTRLIVAALLAVVAFLLITQHDTVLEEIYTITACDLRQYALFLPSLRF